MKSSKTPAVFVLSLFDTGLNTLRLLKNTSLILWGFDHIPHQVGLYTQSAPTHLFKHDPQKPLEEIILHDICLIKLKLRVSHVFIIPASDFYAEWAISHLEELKARGFFLYMPDLPVAQQFFNRTLQLALVGQLEEINTPSFSENPLELSFPVFARSKNPLLWQKIFDNKGKAFSGIHEINIFRNENPLFLKPENQLFFQEILQGPINKHFEVSYLVSRDLELIDFFIMRKLSQFPPLFGSGAMGIVETDLKIIETFKTIILKLIQKLKIVGVANTEFKYCEKRQKWYYLETNLRVWQQIDLAAAAGQNFPLQLVNLAFTENGFASVEPNLTPPFPPRKRKSHQQTVWIDPFRHLYSGLVQEPVFIRRLLFLLWTWPNLLKNASVWGPIQLSDPKPFIYFLMQNFNALRIIKEVFWLLFFKVGNKDI